MDKIREEAVFRGNSDETAAAWDINRILYHFHHHTRRSRQSNSACCGALWWILWWWRSQRKSPLEHSDVYTTVDAVLSSRQCGFHHQLYLHRSTSVCVCESE